MRVDFYPVAPLPGYTKEFLELSRDRSVVKQKNYQLKRICEQYWKKRNEAGKIWTFLEKVNNILQKRAEDIENRLEIVSIM